MSVRTNVLCNNYTTDVIIVPFFIKYILFIVITPYGGTVLLLHIWDCSF